MARVTHYASLMVGTDEIFGTAERLSGSGYLFRPEGLLAATLIDARNPRLMLYGRCDLADAQYLDDELQGGPAGVACGRAMEVR